MYLKATMKTNKLYISHRGNLTGPIPEKENTVDYINDAIHQGFDVEIDIWYVHSNLFLGHDAPTTQINLEFLLNHSDKLWIHCKNIEALSFLKHKSSLNVFWHENDQYTLTSKGYIWTYPNVYTTDECVIVAQSTDKYTDKNFLGVCSDYIQHFS